MSLPLLWQLLLPYCVDLQRAVSALDTLPAAEVGSAGRIPPRRPLRGAGMMASTVASSTAAGLATSAASASESGGMPSRGSSTGPPHEELLAFVDVDGWSGRVGLTASEFADFLSGALDAAKGLWQRPGTGGSAAAALGASARSVGSISSGAGAAALGGTGMSSLGGSEPWQPLAYPPSPAWLADGAAAATLVAPAGTGIGIGIGMGSPIRSSYTLPHTAASATTTVRPVAASPLGLGMTRPQAAASPAGAGMTATTTVFRGAGLASPAKLAGSGHFDGSGRFDGSGCLGGSVSLEEELARSSYGSPYSFPPAGTFAGPYGGGAPAHVRGEAPGVHMPYTGAQTLAPPARMPVRVLPIHTAK